MGLRERRDIPEEAACEAIQRVIQDERGSDASLVVRLPLSADDLRCFQS